MRRIGLHPGVYGTSIGLLITGGLAVLSATPVQSGIFWLGVAAIILGILLLIWGLKIDGGHWWKRLFRSGEALPQLYLYENTDHQLDNLKGYIFVWTPTDNFFPVIADYKTYASSIPHPYGKEKDVTLHLFNSGPGDVRHLVVEWILPNTNIPALLRESGIFDGFIESLTDNEIKMCADSHWWSSAISTHGYASLPLLREGETIPIKSPTAFTMALALYVLSKAKRQIINKPPANPDPMSIREIANEFYHLAKPMRPLEIQVSYVLENGSKCRQKFGITGVVRGNANVIKPAPNGEGVYEGDTAGVSGWIDNLRVHTI